MATSKEVQRDTRTSNEIPGIYLETLGFLIPYCDSMLKQDKIHARQSMSMILQIGDLGPDHPHQSKLKAELKIIENERIRHSEITYHNIQALDSFQSSSAEPLQITPDMSKSISKTNEHTNTIDSIDPLKAVSDIPKSTMNINEHSNTVDSAQPLQIVPDMPKSALKTNEFTNTVDSARPLQIMLDMPKPALEANELIDTTDSSSKTNMHSNSMPTFVPKFNDHTKTNDWTTPSPVTPNTPSSSTRTNMLKPLELWLDLPKFGPRTDDHPFAIDSVLLFLNKFSSCMKWHLDRGLQNLARVQCLAASIIDQQKRSQLINRFMNLGPGPQEWILYEKIFIEVCLDVEQRVNDLLNILHHGRRRKEPYFHFSRRMERIMYIYNVYDIDVIYHDMLLGSIPFADRGLVEMKKRNPSSLSETLGILSTMPGPDSSKFNYATDDDDDDDGDSFGKWVPNSPEPKNKVQKRKRKNKGVEPHSKRPNIVQKGNRPNIVQKGNRPKIVQKGNKPKIVQKGSEPKKLKELKDCKNCGKNRSHNTDTCRSCPCGTFGHLEKDCRMGNKTLLRRLKQGELSSSQ
ncbi:hypothetical protein BGZ46_000492 [Entomortierella lignicola]|nr:hypothetical protein BGZ46_000492 [Entomortierella lignicola]